MPWPSARSCSHACGGRFEGCGKVWEVPREFNLIKVAEVILIGFPGIKDSAVLHVIQVWTNGIRISGIFAGVCMITDHLIMCLPVLATLTDHAIMPLTKVLVQETGIFVSLDLPFLLGIFSI